MQNEEVRPRNIQHKKFVFQSIPKTKFINYISKNINIKKSSNPLKHIIRLKTSKKTFYKPNKKKTFLFPSISNMINCLNRKICADITLSSTGT